MQLSLSPYMHVCQGPSAEAECRFSSVTLWFVVSSSTASRSCTSEFMSLQEQPTPSSLPSSAPQRQDRPRDRNCASCSADFPGLGTIRAILISKDTTQSQFKGQGACSRHPRTSCPQPVAETVASPEPEDTMQHVHRSYHRSQRSHCCM